MRRYPRKTEKRRILVGLVMHCHWPFPSWNLVGIKIPPLAFVPCGGVSVLVVADDYSELEYVALMHFFSVKFVMRCETLVMGTFWNRFRWDWFYRFSFTVVMWCYANLLAIGLIVITVTLSLWAGYSCWSQAWAVVAGLVWWLWAIGLGP